MSYVGSYMWNLRQKVGRQTVITVTVQVVPVNPEGKFKLVYARHFDYWNFPGGHAELGDSFLSAALHELEEEVGITAQTSDLELFATKSGPGRIYHYTDGDTQPFTLIFFCQHWERESDPTDPEEAVKTGWFTPAEIAQLKTNPHIQATIDAYYTYQKTHRVQMIVEA